MCYGRGRDTRILHEREVQGVGKFGWCNIDESSYVLGSGPATRLRKMTTAQSCSLA